MTAPPGWYPNPDGTATTRWWDGAEWSERITADPPLPDHPVVRPRAPEGTSPWTVWIWLLVGAEVIITIFAIAQAVWVDGSDAVETAQGYRDAVTASTIASLVASALFRLAVVALAVLDRRTLLKRAVPGPFHWAWTLLQPVIYLIGRSVIVRRRTGRGIAPMIITIAVVVVQFAIQLPVAMSLLVNAYAL